MRLKIFNGWFIGIAVLIILSSIYGLNYATVIQTIGIVLTCLGIKEIWKKTPEKKKELKKIANGIDKGARHITHQITDQIMPNGGEEDDKET